jgi:glycosyltransferase involved in cell wall biosynthesis
MEQLWTGWLGLGFSRSLLNIHYFDLIDREEIRRNNWKERKLFFQMARGTKRILRASRNLCALTPRLMAKAKEINPRANHWVVPFALDLELYPPQPFVEEPVVGLIGSMHWNPSRSAAERLLTRIWPEIHRRMPAARLVISGWNAQKYLGKYMPMRNVQLEENLRHPADFFSRASVLVYAPAKGSGMKIKVLESMAYGTPVVTTWEGVEGITYQNGVHCWVEEDDLKMANRVLQLFENRGERESMRRAARTLMEEKYCLEPVVNQMLNVYEGIGCAQ